MALLPKFEVGRLYQCPKYNLVVYPSAFKAGFAATMSGSICSPSASTAPAVTAAYWEKELNCKIRFSNPNDIFMVVNVTKRNWDNIILHCLFSELEGWIFPIHWAKIVKVEKEVSHVV